MRVEKLKPFEIELEHTTDTGWFEDDRIDHCIEQTHSLKLEFIHLQTKSLSFLNDPRLQNLKGVSIQFEIDDITPLYNLKHLTHLGLPEGIKQEFDFTKFPNLIELSGHIPNKYIGLEGLDKLKYISFWYFKSKDFREISNAKDLKKIKAYFSNIESLHGLENQSNLSRLDLHGCRKLVSLDGLGEHNLNLSEIFVVDCKNLKECNALTKLPNLKKIQLYGILELESLNFLQDLKSIEDIWLNPSKVGVKSYDYYPLVDKLTALDKINNLKGWKKLPEYLDRKVIIQAEQLQKIDELDLIKKNLPILGWTEKAEHGLKQYSRKNCENGQAILIRLIDELKKSNSLSISDKEKLFEKCVMELNAYNKKLDYAFIETDEREELCGLLDNIADAVGLDVLDYPDGIASQWRDW